MTGLEFRMFPHLQVTKCVGAFEAQAEARMIPVATGILKVKKLVKNPTLYGGKLS